MDRVVRRLIDPETGGLTGFWAAFDEETRIWVGIPERNSTYDPR